MIDKLNLDDLLASFADSKNPKLVALRKTLKPLAAVSSTTTKTSSTSHLKAAGPLAAPLPARLQDKIEREAGYEKTKEETDKWNATVRRMKGESGIGVEGARHERLVLPLMGGEGNVLRDANASEWSAKFKVRLFSSLSSLPTSRFCTDEFVIAIERYGDDDHSDAGCGSNVDFRFTKSRKRDLGSTRSC